MAENLELLRRPVTTRVSLTGTLIVARDIAHARLAGRLKKDSQLPDYFKDTSTTQAPRRRRGVAVRILRTYDIRAHGSVRGHTQQAGGSMIMIGKGNRAGSVAAACKRNGGFYLGSMVEWQPPSQRHQASGMLGHA